jgi:hypothetical protein
LPPLTAPHKPQCRKKKVAREYDAALIESRELPRKPAPAAEEEGDGAAE